MAVKIRLARGGTKKRPFYRVVVADVRSPRDGKFIDKVGTYNPLLAKDDENRVIIDLDRVKEWMSKGAKPTESVEKMLVRLGAMTATTDFTAKPQKTIKNPGKQTRAADRATAEAEAKEAAEAPVEEAPVAEAAAE